MNQRHAVTPSRIDGVIAIESRIYGDGRGFFCETWRESDYRAIGVTEHFVQDNHSRSHRGVIRGLHLQTDPPQATLVRAARGAILHVVADVRPGSPTYGQWEAVHLDDVGGRQLYVPAGVAHGFCVLSHLADVCYRCSAEDVPGAAQAIRYDDPDLAISWPLGHHTLSARDLAAPTLREWRISQGLTPTPSPLSATR